MLCRDISGLFYPFLDVREAHHLASHSDLSKSYERVTRYYCSQLAYLASRLEAMPEGAGTVLDNSCIVIANEQWTAHTTERVPLLMAGGLGGAFLYQFVGHTAESNVPGPAVAEAPHVEARGLDNTVSNQELAS